MPLIITRLNDCEIASSARIVVEYAEKGDVFSSGILEKAVEYLSMQVNAVYNKLNLKSEETVEIIFVGSIFKSSFFKNKVEDKLKNYYGMANTKFSPVVTKPVDGGINIGIEKFL